MTDFAEQAILDFLRLAERTMPVVDESLYRYKKAAYKMSLARKKPYVVIDHGNGSYQVWAKDLITKPCNFTYDTEKDGAI